MEDDIVEIGRVVLAKAGRDKGKVFMITEIIDKDYVLIANGKSRPIEKPKKKKIKHLDVRPESLEGLKTKIQNNIRLFDAELRKNLESLGYKV